jgi:ASCH domain
MPPKKALSVRQPWAYAILRGGKSIENRSWPTEFRGPIALHAGRSMEPQAVTDFFKFIEARNLGGTWISPKIVADLPKGAIVGLVDIVDCVRTSNSPWFEGPYGFLLANPQSIKPIACRGEQKFFDLPPNVYAALNQPTSG